MTAPLLALRLPSGVSHLTPQPYVWPSRVTPRPTSIYGQSEILDVGPPTRTPSRSRR